MMKHARCCVNSTSRSQSKPVTASEKKDYLDGKSQCSRKKQPAQENGGQSGPQTRRSKRADHEKGHSDGGAFCSSAQIVGNVTRRFKNTHSQSLLDIRSPSGFLSQTQNVTYRTARTRVQGQSPWSRQVKLVRGKQYVFD